MAAISADGWVAALRRFAAPRPIAARCDLCGENLESTHAHLYDNKARRTVCACRACALLFSAETRGLRPLPERMSRVADLALDDAQWAKIGIPVGLAFIVKEASDAGIRVLYPGAAGVTEARLDLAAWHGIEHAHPVLGDLAPGVEALVVNHLDGRREYYRMPIDRCYALAALLRRNWEGFSGGERVRETLTTFFAECPAS